MRWLAIIILVTTLAHAQVPDLPGYGSHPRSFGVGSLIIPMDNTLQSLNGQPFNLKSYGAVVQLLNNAIPVYWVIRSGKLKDEIDFNVTAARILPTSVAATTISLSGGPFFIDSVYRTTANTILTSYGQSVAVYNLTVATSVDVRHLIGNRPYVMVSNFGGNANIHTAYLVAAGWNSTRDYIVIADFTQTNASTCATSLSEPHTGSVPVGFNATIRSYIGSGGNMLAECAAVETFEAAASLFFTNGLTVNNVNHAQQVDYPTVPFNQYIGTATADIGGSVDDWQASVGSALQSDKYPALDSQVTPGIYGANFGRYFAPAHPTIGSVMFYMGGHSYATTNDLGDMNLVRMYLNAMITPAYRNATCGFFLGADCVTTLTATPSDVATNQVGAVTLQANVVPNNAYATPNCTASTITLTLAAGLSFVSLSATPALCAFNASLHAVVCTNVPINGTASLSLSVTCTATTDGTQLSSISSAQCGTELELANNIASASVFSTSTPELVITKAYDSANSNAQLNGQLSFIVTIFNNGSSTYNNIVVNDSLTQGNCNFTSFSSSTPGVTVSFSALTGTWTISGLGVGNTASLMVTCSPSTTTTVVNKACIVSATQTIVGLLTHECANVSAPISCLTINKVGNDSVLILNTEIELFTITIKNQCSCELYNVTATDVIPSQIAYTASSFSGSYNSFTSQAWDEPFGTLTTNTTYSTGNWPNVWNKFGEATNFNQNDIREINDLAGLPLGPTLQLTKNTKGIINGPLSMDQLCQNNTVSITYRESQNRNDGAITFQFSSTGNGGPWTTFFTVQSTGIISLIYATSTSTWQMPVTTGTNIYIRVFANDANNNDKWNVRDVFIGSFLKTGTTSLASAPPFTPLTTVANLYAGATYNFTLRATRTGVPSVPPILNTASVAGTQCGAFTFSPPSTTVATTFACSPSTSNFTVSSSYAMTLVNTPDCRCNNTAGETFVTMPSDCTPCNNDTICADTENPQTCPNDCPVGLPCNSNGRCDANENFASCPADCTCSCNNNGYCDLKENVPCSDCDGGPCQPNGRCDLNENFSNCPADCQTCVTNCMCQAFEREWCTPDCVAPGACDNDGVCDANENSVLCSVNSCDCNPGMCNSNGACEPFETEACPDCRSFCCTTNTRCEVGENAHNCAADCDQTDSQNGMCQRGETQVTKDCGTCV